MQPLTPELVVRGQYEGYRSVGYRSVAQVSPGSQTETFIATRVSVDNDRWAGVPFLLRTGKRMAADRQSVLIMFSIRNVLDDPPTLHCYAQGSWGPDAGDLLPSPRRWPNACAGIASRRAHMRSNVTGGQSLGANPGACSPPPRRHLRSPRDGQRRPVVEGRLAPAVDTRGSRRRRAGATSQVILDGARRRT
jgi:hypothetical protein